MATATQPDIDVTGSWADATVANGALADADVLLQNIGSTYVFVAFGDEPGAGTSGLRLKPDDSVQGNASHIWLRGGGTITPAVL